jgi:hypothetical protein
MKQCDINRAVAHKTGEALALIRSIGFSTVPPPRRRQRRGRRRRREYHRTDVYSVVRVAGPHVKTLSS